MTEAFFTSPSKRSLYVVFEPSRNGRYEASGESLAMIGGIGGGLIGLIGAIGLIR